MTHTESLSCKWSEELNSADDQDQDPEVVAEATIQPDSRDPDLHPDRAHDQEHQATRQEYEDAIETYSIHRRTSRSRSRTRGRSAVGSTRNSRRSSRLSSLFTVITATSATRDSKRSRRFGPSWSTNDIVSASLQSSRRRSPSHSLPRIRSAPHGGRSPVRTLSPRRPPLLRPRANIRPPARFQAKSPRRASPGLPPIEIGRSRTIRDPLICHNCDQTGHKNTQCKRPVTNCGTCGGRGHRVKTV